VQVEQEACGRRVCLLLRPNFSIYPTSTCRDIVFPECLFREHRVKDSLRAVILSLIFCVTFTTPLSSFAEGTPAATVFSLQGTASIQRGSNKIETKEGMQILADDEIAVGEPGRVALELPDGSYIRLPSRARMKFSAPKEPVGLLGGALHFFSHSEKHPTVVTEHVTAAIRGTEFTISVDTDSTTVKMASGSLLGTSLAGQASLSGGEGARFTKTTAPQTFKLLSSEKSVQWSLFVPFVGGDDDLSTLAAAGTGEAKAVELVRSGKSVEALAALPKAKNQDPCSAASILRARITAASGDADTAATLLTACTTSASTSALKPLAQSSLSTIALMRGDVASATALASAASKSGNTSAKLALSFVNQEKGDLSAALAALGEPQAGDSADLIARRAEVLFMFGRVPEARAMLESLSNRSWYAETMLGFTLLADRLRDEAQAAFTRAAHLEPGAGLPLVGLGLVAVGKGDLSGARSLFERATVLEPSRSIYRSYLAKSYFEDDNYDPASPEFERALELDPNDPTPHFYRSFMRLAQNRPVDALRDLEASRELSDKRSVYRSKLLLDEDSAVQSASLARTYRDLGFEERGRIEAISALTQDYRNASAHRLLAETTENVFSADTSLSERRMADLFAPLSINVVDSIGSGVSLNEYSSLFERDGWRTGIRSGYASFDDIGQTGVMTARKDGNYAMGLSASGVVRNGVESSPYTAQGNVGASLQLQPTWGDRLLFEGRGFFRQERSSNEDAKLDNGSFSAAYLHRFSPEVQGIVQTYFERGRYMLQQRELGDALGINSFSQGETKEEIVNALFDSNTDRYDSLWVNEAQLIARTGAVNSLLTLRTSRNQANTYDERVLLSEDTGVLDGLGVTYNSTAPVNLRSDLVSYLSTISLSQSLSLNLGGAYELVEWEPRAMTAPFDADTSSRSRLSPRAGLIYRPSSRVMARVGYSESLGKGVATDLVSLEPTLVGGIQQRYNDFVGTFAQNFGTGIDLRPLNDTYVGAEWTRRWLDESNQPALYTANVDFDNGTVTRSTLTEPLGYNDVQQDFLNTYVYQVVTKQLVLGNSYRYSIQRRDDFDAEVLRDHRSKAFSRYFFSNGVFLQSSATYRYQGRLNGSAVDLGSTSSGWLFGAGIGYRLPTRHGMVIAEVDNILGQNFSLDDTTYFNEPIGNDPMVRLAANFNF
jgi:tetratricopeptide (TPR) repeat protein